MPMWLCASRAARSAVCASTPSRFWMRAATSSTRGTRSRTERTRDRIVGMRSASLGAQRIHTVRSGGSSSAFSSTLLVRSTIRSASSMTMTLYRPTDGENCELETSLRTSSIEMMTRSVVSTARSGCVRASTWRVVAGSPSAPCLLSSAAAKA